MGNAKRKVKRGTIAVLMIFLLGIPAIIYGETPEDLQKAKEREAFRKGSALYFYQIGMIIKIKEISRRRLQAGVKR